MEIAEARAVVKKVILGEKGPTREEVRAAADRLRRDLPPLGHLTKLDRQMVKLKNRYAAHLSKQGGV